MSLTHLADVEHPCLTRGQAALSCRGDRDSLVSGDARVGGRGELVGARRCGVDRHNDAWRRCDAMLWEHEIEAAPLVFRRRHVSIGAACCSRHNWQQVTGRRFTGLAVTAASALMPCCRRLQ